MSECVLPMFSSRSFIVSGLTFRSSILLNFYFYFILLYNTVLVLPYIDMDPTRVYMRSKYEPPSHLPPHNISLGHPRAPAPSILYPASNLDWRFVSYMILYMFQCHSFHFLKKFIYSLLAVLGLHCCVGFSLVAESRGYSLVVVLAILIAVTSLVAEHWL